MLPKLVATLAMLAVVTFLPSPGVAQFSGPSVEGRGVSVADASALRAGTYVTVTGSIVGHLREDYFSFRDATGEMRVEIADNVWQGRQVGPADTVRLLGEVDRTAAGVPYLWVKSLTLVN